MDRLPERVPALLKQDSIAADSTRLRFHSKAPRRSPTAGFYFNFLVHVAGSFDPASSSLLPFLHKYFAETENKNYAIRKA